MPFISRVCALSVLAVALVIVSAVTARGAQSRAGEVRPILGELPSLPLAQVLPEYPKMALAAGIAGAVEVEVEIDQWGTVVSARAVAGHALLRDASVQAASKWRFETPRRTNAGGRAIGRIAFVFTIPDLDEEESEGDSDGSDAMAGVLEEALERVRAEPTSAEAHADLAEVYEWAQRHDEAIASYQTALSIQPDFVPAILGLGSLYRGMGRLDDEIFTYQKTIESLPEPEQVLVALGEALGRRGRHREAVSVWERLTSIDAQNPLYHNALGWTHSKLDELDEAIAGFTRALALEPDLTGARHNLGWIYTRKRQYESAIAAYTHIIANDEKYDEMERVKRELASVYVRVQRYGEAISMLEKMIEETPDFVDAYCQLAHAYLAIDRIDDARAIARLALDRAPGTRCAQVALASVHLREKQPKAAETVFRALAEEPDAPPHAHANLALALLDQRRFDEAIAAVERAIALAPKAVEWRILLGSAAKRAARYPLAESAYRQALEIDPEGPATLNELGYYLADRGEKLDEAVSLLQKAVESEPRNGSFLDSLGWAYFKQGKLDEAERFLLFAVERRPESPAIQEHVGDLHERRGRLERAREHWQRALEMSTASDEQKARLRTKLAPPPAE